MTPLFFIILYFFCLYVQPAVKFPIIAPLRPLMLSGALAAVSGISYLSSRERPVVLHGQIRWIFFFLVFLGVCTVDALVQADALDLWIRFAKMTVFVFFMVNVVDSVSKLKILLYSFIVFHIWIAADGLYGFYTTIGRGSQKGLGGTLGGFLGDTNDFALAMSVMLPYALFLLLVTRGFWARIGVGVCAAMIAGSAVFTFSRGGFLTLALVFGYFILYSPKRVLGLSLAALMVIGALFVIPATYWERMRTSDDIEEDSAIQGRLWAWGAGYRMAVDQPLLGVGPANFPGAYGLQYKPQEARGGWQPNRWMGAHSSYFQILGETGFLGFSFFLGLMWMNLRSLGKVLRRYRPNRGDLADAPDAQFVRATAHAMRASLLAFMLGGAFLAAGYYPHLWLNAALVQILVLTALPTSEPELQRAKPRVPVRLAAAQRRS